MCGTAAAASSRSTVMRTISEPARASAATCAAVGSMLPLAMLQVETLVMALDHVDEADPVDKLEIALGAGEFGRGLRIAAGGDEDADLALMDHGVKRFHDVGGDVGVAPFHLDLEDRRLN